jgi:hypothetical protein
MESLSDVSNGQVSDSLNPQNQNLKALDTSTQEKAAIALTKTEKGWCLIFFCLLLFPTPH